MSHLNIFGWIESERRWHEEQEARRWAALPWWGKALETTVRWLGCLGLIVLSWALVAGIGWVALKAWQFVF